MILGYADSHLFTLHDSENEGFKQVWLKIWIERVLDLAFQNKIKSAASSSKMSVTHYHCSTFLATNSKLDLGTNLTQYNTILQQAA